MSASSDKLPPVPSQTALADPSRPSYFGATWSQWFTQVKAKVDIINASIVGLASISGTGLTIRTSTGWVTRSIQGTTGEVEVLNGDGVGGNPTIQLAATAVTPGSYTNTDITVDAFGRVTAASNGTGSGAVSGPASSVDNEVALFSGTTGKLLKGGGLLGDAVRAALLTGLSLVTSTAIAATDSVLQAFGKLQAQITNNLLPKGYIDGLLPTFVSATAVTIKSGACYIPGSGKVVRNDSDIALTGLAPGASTWAHLYVYESGGVLAGESSATAPAAPYNGSARCKTGDNTRRYVGSILTDASGNIYNWSYINNIVMWENSIADAPFLVISLGRATTATNIACSGCVPATAKVAVIIMATPGGTADAAIGNSVMTGALSSTVYLQYVGVGVQTTHFMPLDSSQRFSYRMTSTTTSSGFYARVVGYILDR